MRFLGFGQPPAMASLDDGALLRRATDGDRPAFAEIARRHFEAVYRLTWRMTGGHPDTEDIAQEAFVKLWQNPAQVREAAALKGWLMRVAANAAIDRSRKARPVALDDAPDVADGRPAQDEVLEQAAAATTVDRHIAGLPDRQRMALTLVHFEGLSNIAAAEAMEISVEAVESLLARARRSLKASLAGQWRELLDGFNRA